MIVYLLVVCLALDVVLLYVDSNLIKFCGHQIGRVNTVVSSFLHRVGLLFLLWHISLNLQFLNKCLFFWLSIMIGSILFCDVKENLLSQNNWRYTKCFINHNYSKEKLVQVLRQSYATKGFNCMLYILTE